MDTFASSISKCNLLGKKIRLIFFRRREGKSPIPFFRAEKMTVFAPLSKVTFMSHLTQEQRYTIFRMLQAKCTRKEICIAIGKDKSVLSRELKRNSGKRGYSPLKAQEYAKERKERFKVTRKFTPAIKQKIVR